MYYSRVLARPLSKDIVPFGASNATFGSAPKPTCNFNKYLDSEYKTYEVTIELN